MLASGVILASIASVLLVQLPLAWPLCVMATILWCIGSGFELWRGWRRYREVAGFRLYADGSVDVEAPDGALSSAALAGGTVALRHLAWFRFRTTNGHVYAELISRNTQNPDDWRRFRVICRHVAAC